MGLITSNITISGSSTSSLSLVNLPTASSLTNILVYNSASGNISYTASSAVGGGGSGTPGGNNTEIQFNSGSTFSGSSNFTFNYISSSLSIGQLCVADGLGSISFGRQTSTSGDLSLAGGAYSLASGEGSISIGNNCTASGDYSVAFGEENRPSGVYSFALGYNNNPSGTGSVAFGDGNSAVGDYSFVVGTNSVTNNPHSIAFGQSNTTNNDFSIAMGVGLNTKKDYQTVVGQYNDELKSLDSLFVVGIGQKFTPSNGFSVEVDSDGSGSIVIPTNLTNPTNPQIGSMYFNPSTNLLYIYNGTAWKSGSFA